MRETLRDSKELQETKKGMKIINFHALTDHMRLYGFEFWWGGVN